MGRPMAEALHAAGFETWGLDIRPPRDYGAFHERMTDDAAAFAGRPQIIFTVVRDIPQTEALLFGPAGLLSRAERLQVLAICSTVSPRYVRGLRERVPTRIALVDAPMSGAPIAAQERRLSFMLGGETEVLDRIEPLLQAMGTRMHRMGGLGAGMTAKVLNNLSAAASITVTRLAMEWGEQLGVAPEDLRAVMHDSSGQTWFGSNFERIAFAREGHDPENTIGIVAKDVASALDVAPPGADTALPEALIQALRALRPI